MASANALDPLEKLHKRIIRILTKSPYRTHTTPLFEKLKLLIIKRYILEISKKMYCHQINPDIHSTNPILKLTQIHSQNTSLASKINYALPKKKN